MIQDIAPHKLENQFGKYEVEEDDYVLFFHQGKLGVKGNGDSFSFWMYKELTKGPHADLQYLLRLDGHSLFWRRNAETEELNLELTYISKGDLRKLGPKEMTFAALTAWHLISWYESNRFCGRCGQPLQPGTQERSLVCSCGNTVYPRINPAVIVAVTNEDQILLTKYQGGAYRNYALIAGFTEIGETVEETVAREVLEETGVRVKNITYYKSQPWGMTDTLLMGYFCELDGDETISMDAEELSVAEWVRREDIHIELDDFSLTNEMICKFKGDL